MCGRGTYWLKMRVFARESDILYIQIIQAQVVQITLVKHLAIEEAVGS